VFVLLPKYNGDGKTRGTVGNINYSENELFTKKRRGTIPVGMAKVVEFLTCSTDTFSIQANRKS